MRDTLHAIRRLVRSPAFTLTAVLTLALGIGANAAVFAFFNAVVLRPLSLSVPANLVSVTRVERTTGRDWGGIRAEEAALVAEHASSVLAQVIRRDLAVWSLSGDSHAERVSGELVSGNYFSTFDVMPRLGRLLQPADDVESIDDTPVVISERLWHRLFGADPSAIGRTVIISGHPLVVIGVAPDTFGGTWLPGVLRADAWVPVRAAGAVSPGPARTHRVLALVRDGVSLTQADAAIDAIGRQLPPWDGPALRLAVRPGMSGILPDGFTRAAAPLGAAVLGLSGLVFLIACANLTNLLLARGTARAGEFTIRAALGASRRHLTRLWLDEVTVLMTLAAIGGIAVAWVTTRLAGAYAWPTLDGMRVSFEPAIDFRVILYAFAIATCAAVVVGVVLARRTAGIAPWRGLASAGAPGIMSGARAGTMLVAWQVAMTVVLVIGAGLYGRSALASLRDDPGFDVSAGVMASVDLSDHRFDERAGRQWMHEVTAAVERLPGVQRAALVTALPGVTPGVPSSTVGAEAHTEPGDVLAREFRASPGLFRTLGVALRAGRDFSDSDAAGGIPVAIVSESLAATLWPDGAALGRRIRVGQHAAWFNVVGVAADTTGGARPTATVAAVYLPLTQHYVPAVSLVARAERNPSALVGPLVQAMREIDATVAIVDARTIADTARLRTTPFRVAAAALGTLAVLAIGIAMLGIYGVTAIVVARRTREIGLRKALGADARDIRRLVLGQGVRMMARGLAPGLIVSALGAGLLRGLVYDISPRDPVTFLVVPLAVMAAGLAACYPLARRAMRVDPAHTLREQ